MSANKMLIDATHPEETRVVVLKQGRVEEFDYESAARKILRGNIYLAKVTRVEPSLQAAFVEYGGNRHGFLAFSEIHPDYYQIPMADRQALLEQEAMAEAEQAAADDAEVEDIVVDDRDADGDDFDSTEEDDTVSSNDLSSDDDDLDADENGDTADDGITADDSNEPVQLATDADGSSESGDDQEPEANSDDEPGDDDGESTTVALAHDSGEVISEALDIADSTGDAAESEQQASDDTGDTTGENSDAAGDTDPVDEVGAEDALEELQSRPRRRPRSYKIQEVIKRRQVILVQVVKEERGNKGAALTTYLSLAGRYTVLMPNTARGGGISRKITNPQDRKRLKTIANELDVPEGMGLIVRTAGASRTKQELRRDFEYLLRLWESVRDLTLESSAPSLVYEEGNLIKRSIRDLYNKDIDEVLVAGSGAYKQAKEFMRMLMPSHAKNVVHHQQSESLFTTYGIERQLNAMFSPQVTLRSGGYLIINQTEALVAIDVNSGKATREFSIEQTALATNLEAASEIARQLKLRDLAGLVVIDFIDMDERRNNRSVERHLKEALRHDRARIQFGRISHFGLMEMSRQRLRTGVLEGSTTQCPHCQGTGIIRSTESVALSVLRAIEDAVLIGDPASIIATTSSEAAIYILNNKRGFLNEIEHRHGITVSVQASEKMQGANFTIGKVTDGPAAGGGEKTVVNMDWGFEPEQDSSKEKRRPRSRGRGRGSDDTAGASDEQKSPRKRRRRRGRRGERSEEADAPPEVSDDGVIAANDGEPPNGDSDQPATEAQGEDNTQDSSEGTRKPRRRRGRRGGNRERRGRGRKSEDNSASDAPANGEASDDGEPPVASSEGVGDQPRPARADSEQPTSHQTDAASADEPKPAPAETPRDAESAEPTVASDKPKRRPRRSTTSSKPKLEHVLVTPGDAEPVTSPPTSSVSEDESASSRRGWWQKRLGRD